METKHQDLWDKARELGYDSFCRECDCKENPFPFSEDVESLHVAWQIGWGEAENAMIELDAGYHL